MRTPLLDHGYVEMVERWGSDERIIESARMSTDGAFRGWGPKTCPDCGGMGETTHDMIVGGTEHDTEQRDCRTCKTTGNVSGDEKLLRYLYEHKHMTPFEMCGLTIEVQAPIFVFREWHRHRTQSYSELSARYTELPDVFYVPSDFRLNLQPDNKNKQAAGRASWKGDTTVFVQNEIQATCKNAYTTYTTLLNMGVAREVARTVLPVGMYSHMRASANLRNWLGFLTLRMDPAAQWEIRQFAEAVGSIVRAEFPRTWALFNIRA